MPAGGGLHCGHGRRSIATVLARIEWGVGQLVKPYQKLHPPIALSPVTPNAFTAGIAGERGWMAVSGNVIQPRYVATHWSTYVQGCERAGRQPDPSAWRVARSILVTDDAALAADAVADPEGARPSASAT